MLSREDSEIELELDKSFLSKFYDKYKAQLQNHEIKDLKIEENQIIINYSHSVFHSFNHIKLIFLLNKVVINTHINRYGSECDEYNRDVQEDVIIVGNEIIQAKGKYHYSERLSICTDKTYKMNTEEKKKILNLAVTLVVHKLAPYISSFEAYKGDEFEESLSMLRMKPSVSKNKEKPSRISIFRPDYKAHTNHPHRKPPHHHRKVVSQF